MAVNNKVQQAPEAKPQDMTYPLTAVSLARDPETQRWMMVEIPYNILHQAVGEMKTTMLDADRGTAIERFKIRVGELEIL